MTNIQVLEGDCRETLKTLPDECVDMCVTSPPYYNLRDYGTAEWEGGDPFCDHSLSMRGARTEQEMAGSPKQKTNIGSWAIGKRDCPCGAKRIDSQIGLEETPEEFIDNLVQVFREVRRVLKDDGIIFVNLGDSYAGGKINGNGCKPKDLIGTPWMLAFALRNDGWFLRSDIIWHKLNPMPESVTDRPTKTHEYIFMLSKSEKYYYNAKAIYEPSGEGPLRNKRSVWSVSVVPFKGAHFATFPEDLIRPCIRVGCREGGVVLDPFGGSGTTGRVALDENRSAILCELNPVYAKMLRKRTEVVNGDVFFG